MLGRVWTAIGRTLARYLEQPVSEYEPFSVNDPQTLRRVLRPADVLLVEGDRRISVAIKYLTRSTWSHAAVYVGDVLGGQAVGGEACSLVEADLVEGVIAVPLSRYARLNTRICRPVGLTTADRDRVVEKALAAVGSAYDLKNVIDLARYLLPQPPVPVRWRRRMLALGSGDPTRAICSTLIAQAFQAVRYPILPHVRVEGAYRGGRYTEREILHIRHHSLFAPRDFDLSPYFAIVKPTLEVGFDYRRLEWGDDRMGEGDARAPDGAADP